MKLKIIPMLLTASVVIGGCSQQKPEPVEQTESPIASNFDSVYSEISSENLKQHTKVLSSDEFEGRLPATVGEEKTLEYLVNAFTAAGLSPGNGDSFLQPVDLIQITADPNMVMTIGDNEFAYQQDMVASSKREQDSISLENSELVFVGYGVNAPEYEWNDYEGLDVEGKTVVILINDPGFENPESGKFQGTTMTYYGRWSYKYEEASRQGAAGALIVHETAPASYGWSVVANSWSGPQYGLPSADNGASRVAVEGWLTLEAAQKVFADAGLDFATEKANAMQGPYNKAMPIAASVTVNNSIERSASYNVFATLPGTEAPDEHIIYTAHWDHLGKDESKDGDQIYNGAHDNATGTAASIVMAEAFASLNVRPKRSVSFLIVTAEEQGLLGSKYYAENPIIPLDKTVANINMDAMNVLGRTKDVSVIGMGKSELENYLEAAATRQGRVLTQEGRPEAGYYYRSDHFSFAKLGVPALYAKGGDQPIDEATAEYRKRTSLIVTGCYHQVCDQFRDSWDFGGIEEDTQLLFDVGFNIANADSWPAWNPTSEFQRP
ncbi:M28 family metallopeptidase [Alteromonas sp. ASW11-36]|uniref:M28 family metallopeptidase n=1 Tax=Alteromonas arenosi TaxID=3055817 RepID=A0ABT7SUZ5_9ALTE|nr:M28 family metallopeptidase [Alteromonas sp. ASW11-36]MDM7860008.1 M28 family metallopeptidase [Alteromonas sp. ASW11-36]